MSIFGDSFRVVTFGESHGAAVGCVVDGVPAGLSFSEADVQPLLDRRRPGQNSLTTSRQEGDKVEILSGIENGVTLGTPIAMMVRNQDMRKRDYENTSEVPRPGHADYSYQVKYGIRASSGGGRSSARETVGRVCASAIALKYLYSRMGTQVVAFVDSVMDIEIPSSIRDDLLINPPVISEVDSGSILYRFRDRLEDVSGVCYSLTDGMEMNSTDLEKDKDPPEKLVTRCPHAATAARMAARIAQKKAEKDSCGGTITCVISNVAAGLGEPVFDKFHAALAQAMLSIPAVKGFEIGSGFEGSRSLTGSQHNDRFLAIDSVSGKAQFASNHAGGVLGGVTSGQNVHFRVALKPVSSIGQTQVTCDFGGKMAELTLEGRHDPCVVSRAVQIVESMAALVVMDFVLRHQARHPL